MRPAPQRRAQSASSSRREADPRAAAGPHSLHLAGGLALHCRGENHSALNVAQHNRCAVLARMGNASRYRRCGLLLPALALLWSALLCAPFAAAIEDSAAMPPALDAAMAKYRQDLAAYLQAREAYQAVAKTYWSSIAEKRRSRNAKRAYGAALSIDDYVLDQPPVYSGPPKPRDPSKPPEPPQPPPYVPVVADFLAAAVSEFKFTPRMPRNDGEFKRVYVGAAAA